MRKIIYPYSDEKNKNLFTNEYFEIISQFIPNQSEICNDIKKINSNWNLKKIINSDFGELLQFNDLAKNNINVLKKINDKFCWKNNKNKNQYLYDNVQRSISDFLINKEIDIKSCHYCNLEFVNSFSEDVFFKDLDELLNFAPRKMLEKIDGISETTVNKIIKERKTKVISERDIARMFPNIFNNIIDFIKKELNKFTTLNYEHFTLDHVLSKGEFPYLSLSIFNLVPSCYSCNSKFKHDKKFTLNENLKYIIPSSNEYNFDNFFEFIIKFKTSYQVITKDDITINLENKFDDVNSKEYMNMFRLKGRYEFHKSISFEMLDKRKIYSDSQIKEISNLLKRDLKTVKRDIFGAECFESTNAPFEKYKQDIAEQLGLI